MLRIHTLKLTGRSRQSGTNAFFRHFSQWSESSLLRSFPMRSSLIRLTRNCSSHSKGVQAKLAKRSSNLLLRVLGTGAPGSPAAVYLQGDHFGYLFNCGEEVNRLLSAARPRFYHPKCILITSGQWNKLGGIPGVCIAVKNKLSESDSALMQIFGPPGLNKILPALSRMFKLEDRKLTVSYPNCVLGRHYEDENLIIHYVPVYRSCDNVLGLTAEMAEQNCAMGYICESKEVVGHFSLEKCMAQNLPPSAVLKLKNGQELVKLKDGRVIRSEDVFSSTIPRNVFIVVDCPSERYLQNFLANPAWKRYQNNEGSTTDSPIVIVHFTPKEVMENPSYQQWMECFGSKPKHLIINRYNNNGTHDFVHEMQYQLNLLDGEIFPLLPNDLRLRKPCLQYSDLLGWQKPQNPKPVQHLTSVAVHSDLEKVKVPIVMGEPLLQVSILPPSDVNYDRVSAICEEEYILLAESADDFMVELKKYKKKVSKLNIPATQEFPQILFLGTGSAAATKRRNASGILLHLSKNKRMLLDCGEGTLGQLTRFFGASKILQVLTEIRGIYISHLHADHHMGLIGLLLERENAFRALRIPYERLILFAPVSLVYWIKFFHQNFENVLQLFRLVNNADLLTWAPLYKTFTEQGAFQMILRDLGMQSIEMCRVNHFDHPYGVALKHTSGWKLCYSGDTGPCRGLIDLGQNADVCIHEATMEDGLSKEAHSTRHSTVTQAVGQAKQMRAKHIILTHFSQRYAKLPVLEEPVDPCVSFAFDNMMVRLTDLPKIPLMYPALKCLFREHVNALEHRTFTRNIRRRSEKQKLKNKHSQ